MLVVDRQEVKFVGGPRRKQQRRGKKPKLETEKSKFWGKMYQYTSTESQKKTEDSWKCRKCTKQSSNKTATNNKCNSKKNLQWTTAVRILQQNLQILKIQHQWRLSDVKEIAKKAGMARKVLINETKEITQERAARGESQEERQLALPDGTAFHLNLFFTWLPTCSMWYSWRLQPSGSRIATVT